jgi:hypothetical protein
MKFFASMDHFPDSSISFPETILVRDSFSAFMQTPTLFLAAMMAMVSVSAAADDDEILTLPIRFHLAQGVTMKVKGQEMDMWVTPDEVENTVLPEVNRIWAQANIRFTIESCRIEPLLAVEGRDGALRYVEKFKRGDEKTEGNKRVENIDKLFDPKKRHPTAHNVYLFPFIGSTYQGYAKLGGRHAVCAVWTDKASAGKKPPVQTLLVEPEPMKVGSLARTIAHELGHNLGLTHPPKDLANPTPSIMGGRLHGYGMTREEIEKARAFARKHGAVGGDR